MVGLFFIYATLWYLATENWMPSSYLAPIGSLIGLCALLYTGIFAVSKIKGDN